MAISRVGLGCGGVCGATSRAWVFTLVPPQSGDSTLGSRAFARGEVVYRTRITGTR